MAEASTSNNPFVDGDRGMAAFDKELSSIIKPENVGVKPNPVRLEKDGQGGTVYNGLPYNGPVFQYKESDPDSLKPQLREKAKVQIFNMAEPKDVKDYEKVMQQVCHGTVMISKEMEQYDNEIHGWRIFLRWMELSYGPPAQLMEKFNNGKPPKKARR